MHSSQNEQPTDADRPHQAEAESVQAAAATNRSVLFNFVNNAENSFKHSSTSSVSPYRGYPPYISGRSATARLSFVQLNTAPLG